MIGFLLVQERPQDSSSSKGPLLKRRHQVGALHHYPLLSIEFLII
jgi:hypothetical protein